MSLWPNHTISFLLFTYTVSLIVHSKLVCACVSVCLCPLICITLTSIGLTKPQTQQSLLQKINAEKTCLGMPWTYAVFLHEWQDVQDWNEAWTFGSFIMVQQSCHSLSFPLYMGKNCLKRSVLCQQSVYKHLSALRAAKPCCEDSLAHENEGSVKANSGQLSPLIQHTSDRLYFTIMKGTWKDLCGFYCPPRSSSCWSSVPLGQPRGSIQVQTPGSHPLIPGHGPGCPQLPPLPSGLPPVTCKCKRVEWDRG